MKRLKTSSSVCCFTMSRHFRSTKSLVSESAAVARDKFHSDCTHPCLSIKPNFEFRIKIRRYAEKQSVFNYNHIFLYNYNHIFLYIYIHILYRFVRGA